MNQFFIFNLFFFFLNNSSRAMLLFRITWLAKTLLALPSLQPCPPTLSIFDSVGLGWDLRICIYYTFSDEAAAGSREPDSESPWCRDWCKRRKRVSGNRFQYLWLLHITSCVTIYFQLWDRDKNACPACFPQMRGPKTTLWIYTGLY